MRPAVAPSPISDRCTACAAPLSARAAFQFQTAGGPVAKCWRCALRHPAMLRRSAAVAVVIGSVLTAINQGDALLAGQWSATLAWKVPLTYLVPFAVATWGALVNGRILAPGDSGKIPR
jgi:hypothetical protein